jgi:hypothetical protein
VTRFARLAGQAIWPLAFGLLAIYIAARMGAFALSAPVETRDGVEQLANTFASVDHPFHVARAQILWRELGSGHLLRWVSQHQGGYPVEFYPLGEAWLEVLTRVASLGMLSAEGAHTLAVIAIFLLPAVGFAALARLDGWSMAPALVAMALHVSLPGSWYDGGYTELVQWGLVTNVAGATATFLMLPLLLRYLVDRSRWAAAAAAVLAAFAIYSNPRSLVGLAALGAGAWLASILIENRPRLSVPSRRLVLVGATAALLAAPELMALARFDHLYAFVRYSGYDSPAEYAGTALRAVGAPVLALALGGLVYAAYARRRLATRATALSLVLYIGLTLAVAFVPVISHFASQLEPTRLMPVQRLLTIYLAASTLWAGLQWLGAKLAPALVWTPEVIAIAIAVAIVGTQTRSIAGYLPDPASADIPAVGLYPVAMSAAPEQADFAAAVRLADRMAPPGTAILILGSALSWHEPLWAPLWTTRPLFYDNWLWYWHPFHAGTPGYRPTAGNHYPDPERAIDRDYFARHGIGAVLVAGATKFAASNSSLLQPLREGTYDAYLVRDPVTAVTFGDHDAAQQANGDQSIEAKATQPGSPIVVRSNWYPRWSASIDGSPVPLTRRRDGYIEINPTPPAASVDLVYDVQVLDWVARGLAAAGVLLLFVLGMVDRRIGEAR